MHYIPFFPSPIGPVNIYSYFVGYNPPTSVNPYPKLPNIRKSVFLSPFSFIVGDVTVEENTYVAPFVSIRADEGTPFFIGSNSNLQDGVVIHGLKNEYLKKNDKKYSVYIGNRVSCAHKALIHGPCLIDDDVFIGFNALVYKARVGKGSFISTDSVVTGVELKEHCFVPPGAYIDTQEKANSLSTVPRTEAEFAKEVERVNREFPKGYSVFYGKKFCSCGIGY